MRSPASPPLVIVAVVAAVLIAACSPANTVDTTTTTTTVATTTTTTTTLAEGLDPGTVEGLREDIAQLVTETERIRGLPFLETPNVTILGQDAFTQRVRDLIAPDLDPVELRVDADFYAMMGILDPGVDLVSLYTELYAEQVGGFYDGTTKELVVPADGDLSAYDRTVLVHELVHALTDQHFEFHTEFEQLVDEELFDEASALQALIEGDATYFQFIYMQELSPADQISMAFDLLSVDTDVLLSAPPFIQEDLSFPYESGLAFVEQLVSGGGVAAVDRAYVNRPTTTEQILHPEKYQRGEVAREIAPLDAALDGWDVRERGAFGEWGLRLVLSDTLQPGLLTQTTDGWGGDQSLVLSDGRNVAFAMRYQGDSEGDTEEVTQALLDHTREAMDVGEGLDSGGGVLFDAGGSVYVFIDRRGDQLYYIASTDREAGMSLRSEIAG